MILCNLCKTKNNHSALSLSHSALSLSHTLEFSLSRYFKRSYQYKLQLLSDIFTIYCKLIVYFTYLYLFIPIAPLECFLVRTPSSH